MSAVTVVDYGPCNLLNVVRALGHCGAGVSVATDPGAIERADRLVLPGVGAFPDCMAGIRARGFEPALREFAASGRPLLGICAGLQVLFDHGEEFAPTPGLGLLPGAVVPIEPDGVDGRAHRIPHVGWAALEPAPGSRWEATVLAGLPAGATVYFVHSFTARPNDPAHRLADVWYDGRQISAAVRAGNIWGVQFHPEKSGETGLSVLRNFVAL